MASYQSFVFTLICTFLVIGTSAEIVKNTGSNAQCKEVWTFCSARRSTLVPNHDNAITMEKLASLQYLVAPIISAKVCTKQPFSKFVYDFCAGAEKLAKCVNNLSHGQCMPWFISQNRLFQAGSTCLIACRNDCITCPETLRYAITNNSA